MWASSVYDSLECLEDLTHFITPTRRIIKHEPLLSGTRSCMVVDSFYNFERFGNYVSILDIVLYVEGF